MRDKKRQRRRRRRGRRFHSDARVTGGVVNIACRFAPIEDATVGEFYTLKNVVKPLVETPETFKGKCSYTSSNTPWLP